MDQFERMLRQQYVIETCESGHSGRHVWNFHDWYRLRCEDLGWFVEGCFRLGMLALLCSVITCAAVASTAARPPVCQPVCPPGRQP